MRVQVDDAGGDHQPICIDLPDTDSCSDTAERDYLALADADIGSITGCASTVDEHSIADNEVKRHRRTLVLDRKGVPRAVGWKGTGRR
ncbi:unannotated protein [freshwater metagenome]|uniref:Unannotated protein n=1 Tax=freshwater metagenome TaxID=449393 RepID=A0A6J7US01_9ZZZZ